MIEFLPESTDTCIGIQEWVIKVMDPFTRRSDERFFNREQLDEAWSWVKEEQ